MKISISLASTFGLTFALLASVCGLVVSSEAANAQQTSARPDWRTSFVPINPWRVIGGQTNYVKSKGVQFCGKIVDVTTNGIRIQGECGPLGTVYYPVNGWGYLAPRDQPVYPEFFVTNYPFKSVKGGMIASAARLMAWYAGTYTYINAYGLPETIDKLDYGIPCGPNPVWIATRQKEIQDIKDARRATEARRMEFLTRDATNGDVGAQYSLGYHYMHGIGCDTNQVMGIYWLLQAAGHGSMGASNDLQQIENPPQKP